MTYLQQSQQRSEFYIPPTVLNCQAFNNHAQNKTEETGACCLQLFFPHQLDVFFFFIKEKYFLLIIATVPSHITYQLICGANFILIQSDCNQLDQFTMCFPLIYFTPTAKTPHTQVELIIKIILYILSEKAQSTLLH